ncbi:Radial spoke head protein 4 A [Phlyctochytrium planicorne]|nr:Radial spoke head protein 4 A [Phlyctochytrium planicorne]
MEEDSTAQQNPGVEVAAPSNGQEGTNDSSTTSTNASRPITGNADGTAARVPPSAPSGASVATEDQPPNNQDPIDANPITPTNVSTPPQNQTIQSIEDSVQNATAPHTPAAVAKEEKVQEKNYDFLKRKDVYVRPESLLPEDSEFALAKAFLMTASAKTEMNLYDHLTTTVMRVLETRPKDAVGEKNLSLAADVFESLSSEIKRSKFNVEVPGAPGSIKRAFDDSPYIKLFKEHMSLFEKPAEEEDKEDAAGEIPDVMDLANLWEWAGVAFGKEETFTLFLSLRKLVQDKPLKSVRLWGKISGLQSPYIIVEGELREGALDEDEIVPQPPQPAEKEEEAEIVGDGEDERIRRLLFEEEKSGVVVGKKGKDKAAVGPLPVENRVGVNKYVYYVCNYVGGPWTRLPDVIPEKLQAARRITKYFTGNLQHQIVSYPAFDGTEAQYLRCQIARISSATVASPSGYYMFDPEEAEGDEADHNTTIIINPEYEGLPNDALLNPSNWVHHVPYILPQGRTTWENPSAGAKQEEGGEEGEENEEENEEGEEGGEENAEVEPETGPPILSSLASDEDISDTIPSWTTRPCSHLSPSKFTPVLLRSTRWPGAIVVAYNDKFANLYVGDGQRDTSLFVPPPLPEVQQEFVLKVKVEEEDEEVEKVVELVESKDPTVEEEREEEEKKRRREEEAAGGGEGGEEGEEGGSEGGEEEED